MKVETFKRELENYSDYSAEVIKLSEALDMLWYQLSGVKGLDPSKERGGTNQELVAMSKLEMMDRINELEKKKTRLLSNISYIDDTLDKLPQDVKKYLVDIYVKKKGYKVVADKNYVASGTIFNLINRELGKVLEK